MDESSLQTRRSIIEAFEPRYLNRQFRVNTHPILDPILTHPILDPILDPILLLKPSIVDHLV